MTLPRIGFIGFGEAARCFARHFADLGVPEMTVFCDGATNRPPYTPGFTALVREHGAATVDSVTDLGARCDVIFSAVVVAAAAPAGAAIAAVLRPGTLVVDINATTPSGKKGVAAAVTARGGAFVDANLMGSAELYGAKVPLYCSGDGAARFAALFAPLGLNIEQAGPVPGDAAAVKMLRSVVTKGMEALLVEAMVAASRAGVRAEALHGICAPMDATSFSRFADMCIRTDVLHAERRAVEMEGVADGLREFGVDPVMTMATAARLRASAALGLRTRFAAKVGYTADDVLDAYVAETAAGAA